ncbi:leucine-rich repeat and IQ domain-containing protein 1-like [Saccostrea echinata]|uniref:leucine-rich repeat and IQ domain-containing protein 1-like n=1 Tax=Saccostrea echinata TaxID=191078 RepID=UPI002A7ED13B|nr:leucine-rich repeat and IQ domain-containing protein 1-like [Saccostrea echinata]
MKSMPPSGVFGVTMDDEALIEAEIAQQLDQINLDADDFQYEENEEEIQDVDLDIPLEDETLPDGMSDYINQIQKQASNFEKELAECDELLQHHTPGPKLLLNEEELGTLEQLAKERGESPETYRKKILEEVEDFDISDFSSLLVDDNDEQKDANDNSMALVHLDEKQLEFQRKFKETLKKMEETQKEREEKLKQEILEDRKREQEDFEGKEKKWMEKFAALQREETQLAAERKIQEEKFEMELKDKEIEIEKELKYYEEEIEKLESETKHEQEQLEHERSEELKKQELKQQQSATKIQARYRGYSVRKQYKETLQEMKEERERKWEEERIKEVEEEIQRQKEEDRQKKIKEEAERKAEEEAKRKKEEEEKKKAEAERKAKEEAKRKAEEEVKRKAEEEAKKKAKEEEAKRKAEEEARRKAEEEAKMKAEEEAKRKMEEEAKRKAEEEAKKKAAEEAKRKEEETKRKAEEEARKQAEEEARKHAEEELKRKEEEAARIKAEEEARQREEVVATRKAMEAEAVKEPRKGQEIEKSKVPVSGKTSLGSPRPLSARSKSKGKYQEDFDIFEMDDSKKLQTSTLLLQGLPENLEKLRLQWIKECVPWSKVSNEPWKLKSVSSKSIRRPTSAKKLQPLSEATIVMAARVSTLRQVTTVELQDLPGCNISTLGQCWGLKSLKMSKCNLTVIEGLQQCKQLHFLDLQDNFIQYVDLKDLSNLTFLDLSHNSLSTIHGLAGCSNLRWLDLSNNKITRIGGLESLRRLHTLKMSSNQLISTTGLNDTPTLQLIDISNNHLQTVEDISKLCLLQTLMVSSNNLQKLPCLRNHVLLRVLCLEDNSIGDLEELQSDWLPLLEILNLSQNSIEDLVPLNNLLILRHFDISHNQITDVDTLASSVEKCVHLESMCIAGNPATELTEINLSLPNLKKLDDKIFGSGIEVKPRTSFEAMCISQAQLYTDLANNMLKEIGVQKSSLPWDLGSLCDLYFKYCDTTQRLAEEHRYAHEYGEITMAMPTAPSTPKSSQRPASSKSVRQAQRESQLLNPKEMFERALKSSEKEAKGGKMTINGDSSAKLNGAIDGGTFVNSDEKKSTGISAKTVKALVDEDIDIGQSRKFSDLQSVAAMKIQAHWRGHRVRRQIWGAMGQVEGLGLDEKDHEILQELHQAATKIQAVWRGYILRLRLEQALEFAKFEDEDDYDFQEVDLKEFNFDEEMLEDWKPPPTPQLPVNHPVLGKPPSGKQASPPSKVPLLNLTDKPHPPANPRRAWRGMDSPLSDVQQNGHVPRPPSIASVTDTHRTAMSKKEELLSEEWGFKDANTAHMMMQRAKKLKYNAERRKKLGKLDPKQRLALFRRLEETNVSRKSVTHPSRQTLPRKEYFQARQEEIDKKKLEKRVMSNLKNSRTFEWIHNQVGSFEESEHNVHPVKPARQMYGADNNLPRIDPQVVGGRHVRLTGSPALDLQSVDSVSLQGEMVHSPRRFSAGSEASSGARFPPIKTNSAGSGKKRERISFRDNEVKLGVGWGGGKKRGKLM